MPQPLIEFQSVSKQYQMGDTLVKAADEISLQIHKGEFVAILGKSGSGKSTCMNIIGCLDVPTSGVYLLDGKNVGHMNKNELAEFRNEKLGFIFQQYNLLPKMNILENVEVPLMYAGVTGRDRKERAAAMLESVGLGNKLKNLPSQLSGGQQQRVSIARALVCKPDIILADEPTGALDGKTGAEVLELLQKLNEEGNTVVLITHDNSIAAAAKRIVRLSDGKVIFDGPADSPEAFAVASPPVPAGGAPQ
jgi:putative ABC transport system ATP-binding protein